MKDTSQADPTKTLGKHAARCRGRIGSVPRRSIAFGAGLLVAAWGGATTASPGLVELQWRGPAACPSEAEVRDAVAAFLPPEAAPLRERPRVDAEVTQVDGVFDLRLRLRSVDGERTRELRAARCESLADAVALEVALLYDRQDPPEPEPPPPSPAVRWRVRAGALVGNGVAEGTLAAATLGVALLGRGFAVDLDLAHWPRGFAPIPDRPDVGTALSASSATIDGCGRWARERFALAGCGGLEIGFLHARGVGLDAARTSVEPLAALVLIPRLELGLGGPVALSVAPWVRWTIVRPGVRIDGVGEIYRADDFGFGGAVRLEIDVTGRNRAGRDMSRRAMP